VFIERRFAHDFNRVWVHTDNLVAHSDQAIHARAYTVGNRMVFGSGQYSPVTAAGCRLFTHEMMPAIQQGERHLLAISQPLQRHEVEIRRREAFVRVYRRLYRRVRATGGVPTER